MMRGILTGELVNDPVRRVTKNGFDFATTAMRDGETIVSVTVFEAELVDRVMRLRRGSSLSAAGALKAESWVDKKTGATRYGWRLTVSALLSFEEEEVRDERLPE